MAFVFDLKYLSQNSINFNMLGVFWNPQDEQISKLSLDLHLKQHLKEILRFFTAAGAVCHFCILWLFGKPNVKPWWYIYKWTHHCFFGELMASKYLGLSRNKNQHFIHRSKLTKWVTNQNQCYFNSLNIATTLLLLTLVCAYNHFIKISIIDRLLWLWITFALYIFYFLNWMDLLC